MPSSLRTAAIGLSAGRAALGLALLATPERIVEGWIGQDGRGAPAKTLARSVGVRDIVLGAGAAAALLSDDGSAAVWLAGSAICDAGDMLATFIARDSLPANGVRGTLALAGASALLASVAAARS